MHRVVKPVIHGFFISSCFACGGPQSSTRTGRSGFCAGLGGSNRPGNMFICHLPIKGIHHAFDMVHLGGADMAWVPVCQVRRPWCPQVLPELGPGSHPCLLDVALNLSAQIDRR